MDSDTDKIIINGVKLIAETAENLRKTAARPTDSVSWLSEQLNSIIGTESLVYVR
jgi:hypothetical protein